MHTGAFEESLKLGGLSGLRVNSRGDMLAKSGMLKADTCTSDLSSPARCAAMQTTSFVPMTLYQCKPQFSLDPLHIIYRGVLIPNDTEQRDIWELEACKFGAVPRYAASPFQPCFTNPGMPNALAWSERSPGGPANKGIHPAVPGSPVGGNGINIWDTAAALKHDLHRCSIVTTLMSHWLH